MTEDNALGVGVNNFVDEFSSAVSFSALSTAHSGRYSCVASNAAAAVTRSANLRVSSKFNYFVRPNLVKLILVDMRKG